MRQYRGATEIAIKLIFVYTFLCNIMPNIKSPDLQKESHINESTLTVLHLLQYWQKIIQYSKYFVSHKLKDFPKNQRVNWFKDSNGHILESKNRMHRLLYCPLCQKLIFKANCQKLRQDKQGNLYKVKRYHYDKLSKLERAQLKEQKEEKRLQELPSIELSKIIRHIL
jgi:hypothetical protein